MISKLAKVMALRFGNGEHDRRQSLLRRKKSKMRSIVKNESQESSKEWKEFCNGNLCPSHQDHDQRLMNDEQRQSKET